MATINLKALVDKRSNKIIFIECGNDFVDVLFSFLTMPMGTILRLARKHSLPVGISCMRNLYASVENIGERDFWKYTRDLLLRPHNAAESHCKCLKLNIDDAKPTSYFLCPKYEFLSYYPGEKCPCCGILMQYEQTHLAVDASEKGRVFVKRRTRVIVSDDLQVIPMSAASFSLLKKLGVTDVNATEELTFTIGIDEVLNLLLSSLVSKTPLTATLLKHKLYPKLSSENDLNQARSIEPQMVGDTKNEAGNISIKLIVSKSKRMVCYAEAGEDFVNLLFNFLTLPLGFILKQMGNCSWKGCTDHLYKSVKDLDGQYMRSNINKKMLLNPKVVPGFCYGNSLLGIEEASYYYLGSKSKLTTDRSLIPKSAGERVIRSVHYNIYGYLEGPAIFTVTDNLVVRPKSPIFELSVLKDLNVPFTDIEERIVRVGKKMVLRLLLASFVCDSALTNTFIRELNEPKQEK